LEKKKWQKKWMKKRKKMMKEEKHWDWKKKEYLMIWKIKKKK